MPPAYNLLAASLDTNQPNVFVSDERVEHPDRIAAAPTHATIASGNRPASSRICCRASRPITD